MTTYHSILQCPLGDLELIVSDKGLRQIQLHKDGMVLHNPSDEQPTILVVKKQLLAYFDRSLEAFDLPIDFEGATKFEQQVWHVLLTIPYGKTICYSDIANTLNNPKAVRAVGTANGRNPIPIIVPCHRVIGKNGSLTGFSLGLDVKKTLLKLENPQRFVEQGRLF